MAHEHRRHQHEANAGAGRAPAAPPVSKDPVCGMEVVPGEAGGGRAEHGGATYWFCSPRCRATFVADPERYVAPAAVKPP